MPGTQPVPVILYRIVHIDNVQFILRNGMFTKHHPNADPNYKNIGDSSLITARHTHPVNIIPPGGNLGDYVPFYFGPLSPMLYKIMTGHGGVTQKPQEDIVYICCKLSDLTTHCSQWCFTDGHAKTAITEFYNNTVNLDEIDWDIVPAKKWKSTEADLDRMRKKQAEFLVRDHVPQQCISQIVVKNQQICNLVTQIIANLALQIPVHVNPNNKFYY